MLSISWSTGSPVNGEQFIVVVDTVALEYGKIPVNLTLKGGTTLQSVEYGRARYPVDQYIVPPIVVFTTAATTTNGGTVTSGIGVTTLDLRDSNGCGRLVTEGIAVLHPNGATYGTVVTVEWRPRPVIGPCKQ